MGNKNDTVQAVDLDFVKLNYSHSSNLLEIEFNSNFTIELEHMEVMVEEFRKLVNDRSALFLVTSTEDFLTISTDCINFLADAQRKNHYSVATAFVTKILANRISASFYIKFAKPPQPCKIFKTKDDALVWLSEFSSDKKSL